MAAETALLGFIGFPSAVDFEFHSKIAKKRSVYIANELKRCMQPLCLKSSSDCFGRILLQPNLIVVLSKNTATGTERFSGAGPFLMRPEVS